MFAACALRYGSVVVVTISDNASQGLCRPELLGLRRFFRSFVPATDWTAVWVRNLAGLEGHLNSIVYKLPQKHSSNNVGGAVSRRDKIRKHTIEVRIVPLFAIDSILE